MIYFADKPLAINRYSIGPAYTKGVFPGIGTFHTAVGIVYFGQREETQKLWTVLVLANGAQIAVPYDMRVQSLVMGFPTMVRSYEAINVAFLTSIGMRYRMIYLSQKSSLDKRDHTDINVFRPQLDVLCAQFFDYDFNKHKTRDFWRISMKGRGLSWQGGSFKSILPEEDNELLSVYIGQDPEHRLFPMLASLRSHIHWNMIRYMWGTETVNESNITMLYPLTEAQYFYLTFLVGYPPKLKGTSIYVPYLNRTRKTTTLDYPVWDISPNLPSELQDLRWDKFHDFKESLDIALRTVIRWPETPENSVLYSLLTHLRDFIYIPVINTYVIEEKRKRTLCLCNKTNKHTAYVSNVGIPLSTHAYGDFRETSTYWFEGRDLLWKQ